MSERGARLSRRRLLGVGLGAALSAGPLGRAFAASASASASALASASAAPATVPIEAFSAAGRSLGVSQVAKLVLTEEQWRARLTPASFEVTRHAGTEHAFSGAYASNHADGLYRCVCCDTALFDSRTKYESGTGWPSFWKPISPRNVAKAADYDLGVERDAVSCRRCDAHLGHVFDDGPLPTGLRYCMNSVALRFVSRST